MKRLAASVQRHAHLWPNVPLTSTTRLGSSSSAATASSDVNSTKNSNTQSAAAMFERSAAARREVHDLWLASSGAAGNDTQATVRALQGIMAKYNISVTTPREEDITRGLGEAFDRLILLSVPFGEEGTHVLDALLACAGRQGREIPVRTIQHLFARCASYAEAMAVFYSMRKCNVAMNMEAYYAMLYSLQRLEEESWALKFADELEGTKAISAQAMDFILNGCDNQLLPENKPWLGRVMYQDQSVGGPPSLSGKQAEYDALGEQWMHRYKEGASASLTSRGSGQSHTTGGVQK